MEFTTHNNEAIETTGLAPQGVVDANRDELVSLFGKPIGNNFVVKFKDESRALLYPSSADHWYVEGTGKQAITNVQIVIDLHREDKAEESGNPIDKAFESSMDMMASIKAAKGEGYAQLVELALLSRKSMELIEVLTHTAVATDSMPEQVGLALLKSSAMITAKTVGLGARLGKIDTNKHDAEELMDWVERLLKAEGDGVKGLMASIGKDNDD